MPAEVIRASLTKPNLGKLLDLKQGWGVSVAALIQRAYTLTTITAADRTRLFKMLSARGFRITEPGSDRIPSELPRLQQHLRSALESERSDCCRDRSDHGVSDDDNRLLPPAQRLRVVQR